MADFTVINQSTGTVTGGPGDDSLTVIFEGVGTAGVWLESVADQGGGNFGGVFNGPGSNDIFFSAINRFGFEDRSGGADIVRTFGGNDTLLGGGGNDTLHGGAGIDIVDGGTGADRGGVTLSAVSANLTFDLNAVSGFLGTGVLRNIEGFLDMRTGAGNDRITGHATSRLDDGIDTGGGSDRIQLWMGGTDNVQGGAGSDTLVVIYDIETNGVVLESVESEGGGSYRGLFNGLGSNNLSFSGIERVSFTDRSGGNDIVRTFEGNDTLNGGGGADLLHGGAGVDRIDGGGGLDRAGMDLSAATRAVTIDLNGVSTFLGNGRIRNVEGFENLRTGAGDDILTGHRTAALADGIDAGTGADRVTLWMGGTDNVQGGGGFDTLVVIYDIETNGVVLESVVNEGGGSWGGLFNGLGSNDLFFGGFEQFAFTDLRGGNDIVRVFGGNDTLSGGGGDDLLHGGAGIDRIDGGEGTDRAGLDLTAAAAGVTIDLNRSSTFLGTGIFRNVEGFQAMRSTDRADVLTGHRSSGQADQIDAGGGNDRVKLWMGGTDNVQGGAGTDTLVVIYDVATNGVVLESVASEGGGSWGGVFNGMGSNDLFFSGIERVSFADRSGGNDIVRTFEGNDTLNGGGGADLLHGGAGVDRVNGGAGSDRAGVDLSAVADRVVFDLNRVSRFLDTGVLKNVEGFHDLRTGAGNDAITGHASAGQIDWIDAGAGDDRVQLWMGGSDTVRGGGGTDTLVVIYDVATNGVWLEGVESEGGGSYRGVFNGMGSNDLFFSGIERFSFADLSGGADIIRGFAGADTILGGGGDDLMAGGGGRDVFVFTRGADEGSDRIEDFQNGLDRIRLAGATFADVAVTSVNEGRDTLLSFTGGTDVLLAGIAAGLIDAGDFIFA